jgi:hypothetical protein
VSYLKHNSNGNKTKQAKSAKKPEDPARVAVSGPGTGPSLQHDVNYVAGLSDVEESLDWIARGLSRLTDDDHAVGLSLGQGMNTVPVKITLADNQHDDTMDRLVTAFERIADSVAKLAGFSRPRLEHWHEQAEYQPLYRDVACDGGAPGPSADVTGGGGGRSKV